MLTLENEVIHFKRESCFQITVNIFPLLVFIKNLAIFSSLEEEHGNLSLFVGSLVWFLGFLPFLFVCFLTKPQLLV